VADAAESGDSVVLNEMDGTPSALPRASAGAKKGAEEPVKEEGPMKSPQHGYLESATPEGA
jgi:hypothetical protein